MHRVGYNIPSALLTSNTTTPQTGDVAIMRYEKGDRSIMHYAYVEQVYTISTASSSLLDMLYFAQNTTYFESKSQTATLVLISECNMFHLYASGCGTRVITQSYSHLLGYYSPGVL